MANLTQPQLNASTIIRGLVDLMIVNINPAYGFGEETRELVKNHLKGWGRTEQNDLKDIINSIIAILEE